MKTHVKALKDLRACEEAVEYAAQFPDLQSAWDACERGAWMLWLAGRYSGEPGGEGRRPLVLAACACARLSLVHVPQGELRPLKAIETAEAWVRGDATPEQVRASAEAAWAAAAEAARASASWAAAWAAASAAEAEASARASAPWAAAWAASSAAAAAAASASAAWAAAARDETLKTCADIVRQFYPQAPTTC